MENFQERVKNFYTEHIHANEEIRYCLEGSGFFDVRDKDDRWIRIWIKEGDMIVLPSGIYHRLSLDTGKYLKVIYMYLHGSLMCSDSNFIFFLFWANGLSSLTDDGGGGGGNS